MSLETGKFIFILINLKVDENLEDTYGRKTKTKAVDCDISLKQNRHMYQIEAHFHL